jgi:hypothetical protein
LSRDLKSVEMGPLGVLSNSDESAVKMYCLTPEKQIFTQCLFIFCECSQSSASITTQHEISKAALFMERSTSPRRRCFPCGGESPRTIQFEDYPDGNIPQYVALSCSWGDETEAMDLQEIVQVDFDWALLSLRTNEYQAAMISMWRNDVIWNQ